MKLLVFKVLLLCTASYINARHQNIEWTSLVGRDSLLNDRYVNINTQFDEQNPKITPDGKFLYFTRGNHPLNHGGKADKGDIWYAEMHNGLWAEPQRETHFNSAQWNGVIGFSANGKSIYLHNKYTKGTTATYNQGISVAHKTNNGWGKPEPVKMPYYKNMSKHQSACLSVDGQVMILSLESYGGKGAEDLYVSFRISDSEWTEPKNLGSSINTRMQEMTPFLAEDNKTLYFSSNINTGYGTGSFGSSDVYVTERRDSTWTNWSKPRNLGKDINSNGRELHFRYDVEKSESSYVSIVDSDGYGNLILKLGALRKVDQPDKEAVTALKEEIEESQKEGKDVGISGPNIKITPAPSPERGLDVKKTAYFTLEGQVTDALTNKAIPQIPVHLIEENNNFQEQAFSSIDGKYTIGIQAAGVYRVQLALKGYMPVETKLEIGQDEQRLINKDFELHPIKVGSTIKLPNVLFVKSKAILLESAYKELDFVVAIMKEQPNLKIRLSGHTDNQGSSGGLRKLSEDRAKMAKSYLVEAGISQRRIESKGYGGTKPIASNKSEETRKLNRRVEFTILSD